MATSVARKRAKLKARLDELDVERGHIAYALTVLDDLEDDHVAAVPPRGEQETGAPDIPQPSRQHPHVFVAVEADPHPDDDPADLDAARERIRAYFRRGETAAYVTRALFADARARRAEAIVDEMRALGWKSAAQNELESVRAALSRMVGDKIIVRSGYGNYQPNYALKTFVDAQAEKVPPRRQAQDELPAGASAGVGATSAEEPTEEV